MNPPSPSLEQNIVCLENFGVRFSAEKEPLFSDVSFSIPRGAIFGIFGETGCGKTTLGQCLGGFVPLSFWEGKIHFHFGNGEKFSLDKTQEFPARKIRGKKIVYIPQDPYKTLNPFEPVKKQLCRIAQYYGTEKKLPEIMAQLQIQEKKIHLLPHHLSGGQKQRIILACALLAEPELFVLDEPLASIDTGGRKAILDCLQGLSKEGRTLAVICHELQEYENIIAPSLCFEFSSRHSVYYFPQKRSFRSLPFPVLSVQKITKKFYGNPVFESTGLEIHSNEWVYLEGHNGCGKSTFVNMLLGHLSPDEGEIQWLGQKIPFRNVCNHAAKHIHVAFQDVFHSLDPRMKVEDSLREIISRSPGKNRIMMENMKDFLWKHLELPIDRSKLLPGELSYGQQKRLVLLRALLKYRLYNILEPLSFHLLLFDEIFSGIHKPLRRKIIFLLQEMRYEKTFSILWIAHAQDDLRKLCDRVYCIQDGKIVQKKKEKSTLEFYNFLAEKRIKS
ncbi:MAG: ABC transporter ATP-binding protein [Candidatus Brocadiae bacterium]|nr:ABC transporter ATP-binding protein [Candidatus Brocadiia bacterium]